MPQDKKTSPLLWERLGIQTVQKTFAFDLCSARLKSPRTGLEADYYYLETVDWVNVIPITAAGDEVIMIEQYRWGIHQITLEFPGGMLSAGETDAQGAAMRELQEETGYAGGAVYALGTCHPNPAILTNRNFSFAALGVELVSEPKLDPGEDIAVRLVPLADLRQMAARGEITHALTLATIFFYFNTFGFPAA